jgi:hypothetical protein
MKLQSVRISPIAVVSTLVLAGLLSTLAWSQIQAAPSYVPIGVSSSGNTSTVWFNDPSSRQTIACQTVVTPNTGLSSIQCVASRLP